MTGSGSILRKIDEKIKDLKGSPAGLATLNSVGFIPLTQLDTSTVVITSDARLSDARTPLAHNQDATTITSGTLDGDRLPELSATKRGAVPATGTPSGKYLKDDGTWGTSSGTLVETHIPIIQLATALII